MSSAFVLTITRCLGCRAAWPFRATFALAALLLAGLPSTGHAQPLPVPGATVENFLVIAGKQVPLPEGRWLIAGAALTGFDGAAVGAFGRIANIVLFRTRGTEVEAIAEISTNLLPTHDGWGIASACERTDLALSVVRYKTGWDGSCFFVTHTLTDGAEVSAPAAWVAALGTARERGLGLGTVWLTAGFRVANRSDVVDARFHFAPGARGIAEERPRRWRDSGWAASRIERDAARLDIARGVTEWAVIFSGHMEDGIKGRLRAGNAYADPAAPGAALAGSVLERRLAALNDLHRSGLLTAREHEVQAAQLRERGLDPGSEVIDPATVALYKTLSYRPIVSLANVFIDLFWVGQPFAAGVLMLLQVTVNTTKFYFHELAWEQFVGGGTRRDSARVLDFSYIGRGK